MNSGVNLRRAASTPLCEILSVSLRRRYLRRLAVVGSLQAQKPSFGSSGSTHLGRAQIAGHEDHGAREIDLAVVAQRQRRLVQNAEQQVPQRVARLLDFVEQHEAELHLLGVILVQHFLAQQRMRLAMPQVSGRRADQLRDLVAVLELGAVDLDHRAGILYQASAVASTIRVLPEPVGPRNRKFADRRPGAFIPVKCI